MGQKYIVVWVINNPKEAKKIKKSSPKKIQLHTNLRPSCQKSITSNKLNKISKNVNKNKHYKKSKRKRKKTKSKYLIHYYYFLQNIFSYSFSS